jgi:uncharacterized protein (DUF2062 family)
MHLTVLYRNRRTLSVQNRLKYLDALKCLMKKPPQSSENDIPGARSRYDDFLGTHIINADNVHFVVSANKAAIAQICHLLTNPGRLLPVPPPAPPLI